MAFAAIGEGQAVKGDGDLTGPCRGAAAEVGRGFHRRPDGLRRTAAMRAADRLRGIAAMRTPSGLRRTAAVGALHRA